MKNGAEISENKSQNPISFIQKEEDYLLKEAYAVSDKLNMEEDRKGHPSSEFGRTSEVVKVKDSIQGNNGTSECEIFLASPSVSKAIFGTVSENDVNTSRGEEENQTKMVENAPFYDCKPSITSELEEKHVQIADDSKTACEDITHSKTDPLDTLEVSRGESRDDDGLEVAAEGQETAEISKHDKPNGVSLESKVKKNLTELLHVTGDDTKNSSLEEIRDTESVHRLVSAASSEDGRNGLKEKGNMDDNKEENMPVVDWNDKTDNDIPCNTNNDDNDNLAVEGKPEESEADEKLEEQAVEETLEEPINETNSDRPAAKEIFEEPAVQDQPKEPLVEKIVKEPAVEEKLEKRPDEEKLEEQTAEEKLETPATEEKCEEPEPSIHKLVSANSSEDILGALKGKEKTDSTEEEVTLLEKKGKGNTDSTEEEVTLLEKKGKDNTDSTEEEVTLLEKIDREIPYNTNTGIAENPTTEEKTERSAIEEKQSAVEEKLEEPTAIEKEQAIEEKQEKAAVDQKYEEPAIEELQEESEVEENPEGPVIEEPAVEEKLEKSAAEEKLEDPASQEKHEAPAIEEKSEELAVAEKLEEPATSVHTVVSTTSSENILGGLKGKGNTDGIQEKSMPTVVLPNKTENEIPCNANTNVAENLTVKEKLEEPSVEEKSEELTVEKPCAEGHSEERAIDERTASVSELVSTTSSEDILVDLKEKGYRDEIKESLLEKNTPVVDSNDKIDSEIPCNTNNDVAEKSKNEEKNKESAITNFEESAVEESKVQNLEERAIEETLDEQASKERSKEPAVEEVLEEPAVVEISEGPAVEAKFEEPKAEEKSEEPAVEDILGDMNEKDNVGDIKEEMTLLEKNMPTVDLFNKTDSEITRNANNHEEPVVEEKLEELLERTTAEEQFEEPTVAEKLEDTAVEENPEESAIEEKIEEPAGEEKLEEPANSARKLVSATVSEETLYSLKGKSNTDDTQEEETLLEKNMPVVASNDKIGNEINTINDTANNPAIEEKREEPAEPTVEETLVEPKVENQFEEPEVEENPEEPEVEENPEEPTVEEKLEEQAIEEKTEGPGVEENLEKTAIDEKIEEPATSVDKLVSTMSSEDVLGGMRENDSMDDIMEEITPTVKSSHKTDCEFPCNTNNKGVENPTDEEKQEESALEEPIVEEKPNGPTAEEQSEEPAVADNFEKTAVEENLEKPTIRNQESGVEENFEEHAHTTHKLVSATSSEDTLDGLKGKNNTDDIKEENMPVVDSNDEIGSEINTNSDAGNNPAIEGKNEELAVEEKAVEEKLIEPKIENKLEEPPVEKNPENPEVEELIVEGKHEEPAVEEKLEEPGTSADKLISATGCEDILGDMKGNDNMDNITEEIIPMVGLSNKTDSKNPCNTNNNIAEDPVVEEKLEELVAEKSEGSAAKEQSEEPTVEEKFEPAVEENLEEAGVKEQDPGVEEPAASTHKLVSVTGSEEMLDSIKEKGNMDGIKEEVTLLEKNMPVVDSNDKIGSEINTDNDVPNNPAIEEKTEELAVEKSEETAEPSVENFIEPKVENKFEEPPVGKTHEEPKIEEPAVEEPATEEELEGPTVEEKPEKTAVEEKIEESATTVDKLVSTKSFEDILGGMKGNSNMDDINKEVMPTVELSNKTDREIQCNPNNNVVEIPTVEEKQEKLALEEPVVEEKRKGLASEEPTVEEKLEEPEVEERPEGSAAEEHSEEPEAAEKIEESAFQDKFEKPEVAKKIEEPVAEENFEEPANSAHKLVSITGSKETLDGLKGNSNTGETTEELTLLEKNMPVVYLNDKIGSKINTKDDTANNPTIEEPPEELAIQEKSEELTIEAVLIEPNVENKFEEPPVEKNPEELTVDEKHEEAEVEEKLEEPATSVNKLVSAASSEDILGAMKGNDNMDNITVEVTLLKKIMPTVDLSNETGNENPVAEERLEQPVVENKSEAPATIEESEEPAVEQKFEPTVGEKSEEPAVEENLEEPAVKEQELGVEEKNEEPAVEEKHGEPAPPTNKLVSFTSSEEMLDSFKGESNMKDIKEESTLLEKNMSFVNSNDESGSQINTNNDVTNSSTVEENPEQPAVEEKSEPPAKREVEEKLKEPNLENKSEDPPIEENSEEPEVEEKPEEIAVKEKLEEPAVEEKVEGRSAEETPEESALEEKIEEAETPIVKLVSVTSSEDILDSMKENDSMDDIMEENMQAVDLSNKIDSEISCNTDNNISENPTVKENQEEPAVEEKQEEPVVEEKTEGPATEEQSKEPAVVEIFEPAAEEISEEPAIKEQEPGVEEKVEPAVKEELEEPAKSAHKLVTVTSSEEILDGFDGKSNMEEVILLEKNTLVVDSSDEIDSKINTNNDAANNLTIEEKPEEPNVEALIVEQKPEEPAVEEKLEEPSVGKPEGLAVEEKPEEQAVEEKNEEPAAPVIKLVSIVSSEHIIAGMKENDSMDDIMEEVTLLEKNMPTIDLSNKTKSEISCNMNNNVAETSTLEEKQDEPALEEPIVEEKPEEPATEEQSEEPIVAEKFESAVKEKSEEPAVEETLEEPAFKEREPGVEESFEEPAVEEKLEEPATPAHKLDSVTSSDKMLDGFKGKTNMEEVTLLEKNMPVVDSSDEIGSEVNTNNDPANNSTVEEKSEEPSVEEKLEEPPEPAVEEKFPEPKVENKPEELKVKEPTVEESKEPTEGNPEEPAVEKTEEPAAEEKTEEPIKQEVKENLGEPSVEEPVAEEKLEKQTIDEKELAVEEKFEGPAASVHKLVSTTISEDIHDGLEGKGKMDGIKEKTILVENNMPVVDSNDKTGGEIPSIDEKTEKQNREATHEGSEIVAEATRTAEIPKDNKAHGIFSENKVEKNLTELLPVTSDEYESSSFGELTKSTFVHELDSATPSEAIPDSWNGNGDNGGIKEEVTITSIVQKNKDNSIIPEGEADDLNRQDAHTTQASGRTTPEVNTDQSRGKENELNEHLRAPKSIDELETHIVQKEVETENFQQASLNTEEAKDTHGTENLVALSSEEMRVEDSTEKARDGDKKLLSANKDDFTESIQETRDLNSEQEASLTEKIVEDDMKKDNSLEATEVDSLNIEKNLDQTSDKGIAEHLEISSEGNKEEQRTLEYVEVNPSKDLTVDQIADPPASVENILEVVTAEASEDTIQNSNMDEEDLINNEHGQGKTLAVVAKEGLTDGRISDPPSTEIEKSLDSKTEVPQDKEILIIEDSNLKKECSQVYETETILKEREIIMIEENLEATGAETKSFQAITNMSEQIDTEEISYSSSEKKLKQEEEDLNLEMDGVNTAGITDSKEVESSDIGLQNHNKDIIAADNLELQSREIDIGHIIDTPVEKETNRRNNEKISEATEEELIHHTTDICEEINDKSAEEDVSCVDRLEEEDTLSSNQEKLNQEKNPEAKTDGNITTTKEIESSEIVSSSHEEEREKPRAEMDNSEEQLIHQRAEICYSDPETYSLQNSVDPDKSCYAPLQSSTGEVLDIDEEQEKNSIREIDNKLDTEFDRKKDVKMQGFSIPKDDEITYASGTDTADNKQEQVEASLSGIEKVEAASEESAKECISNEIVEENKIEDGTREAALNATPEATVREESSTMEQFEEIKENSKKEETATYPELNPVVRSTECIETDERLDNLPLPLHFKDSDIVMAQMENLTPEEAHITTEAIREQEKGAIATGDIEIPEVPMAATGRHEIDETKAEDFTKDMEVSEGLVYQGRNFPDDCKEIIENSESSRLAKITPAFKNHEKDSAEKVAPKDQEDSDASDTVSCQKLKEEAAEQLFAPEKSEEQEEHLRETSGKDSSDNKQVHQELQATSSEPERGRLEPFGSEQKNKQVECDSKEGPEESRSRESQAEEFEDEEEHTDKEKGNDKGEKGTQETREESSSESPVIVEVSRDADIKVSPKKHQNILSGVGSKVKHSIAKVKKAITGKSSQTKPPSPK